MYEKIVNLTNYFFFFICFLMVFDCLKSSFSLLIGMLGICGMIIFFIVVIPFYFENDIFSINPVVESFFVITVLILIAYFFIHVVASVSSSPVVHVIQTILSIILAIFSVVFIAGYVWLKGPLTNVYEKQFSNKTRNTAARIEDTFSCCGWSDEHPNTYSSNCSLIALPQVYCYDELQKKMFSNKYIISCYLGNVIALISFVVVAFI